MATFTATWTGGTSSGGAFNIAPADTDNVSQGAAKVRETRLAVAERLGENHSWAGDGDDGKHKDIVLLETTLPVAAANELALYTKDNGTEQRLFWGAESAGSEHQFSDVDSTETLTNKTLTTPTVTSFTNAAHDHADATGGGTIAAGAIPADTITQSLVKVATQQITDAVASGAKVSFLLTGGGYTFYPGLSSDNALCHLSSELASAFSYRTAVYNEDVSIQIFYWQAQYIQASPPYDLGDGEIPLFIFVRMEGGKCVGVNMAPDPPWANNGPTDIRPQIYKANGKRFRYNYPQVSRCTGVETTQELHEWLEKKHKTSPELVEITTDFKNTDMEIISHPFLDISPQSSVIMLNTMNSLGLDLSVLNENGGNVCDLILNGDIIIDNNTTTLKSPKTVPCHNISWKNTRI